MGFGLWSSSMHLFEFSKLNQDQGPIWKGRGADVTSS